MFSETKDEDARKRGELLQLYLRTEECLKKMDDKLIRLLNSNLAVDVKEAVTDHQKRLEVKEYVVLVAGRYR